MSKSSNSFQKIILSVFLLISGCSVVDNDKNASKDLSELIPVVTTVSIGSSGGTLEVKNSADPLDGMKIEIPSGAYDDVRTLTVSWDLVDSQFIPEHGTSVTPLITIEDVEGGYSDSLITITIPFYKSISKDAFPMAFFINTQTGKLEPLPLLDYGEDYVTVITRTFSPEDAVSKSMKKRADDLPTSDNKLAVFSFPEKDIEEGGTTDFTPGIDDWEFTNYGTFSSGNGICSGMSYSALLYFENIKNVDNINLFNRYDRIHTEKTWMDNSAGLKLASMCQAYNSRSITLDTKETNSPENQYAAIVVAIQKTGQPQYLRVATENSDTAHAIIVFKAENNMLWISDPNYPGKKRTIEVKKENTRYGSYTIFQHIARKAFVNESEINSYWEQIHEEDFGTPCFPVYDLKVTEDERYSLKNGFTTDRENVTLQLGCPTCPFTETKDFGLEVYDMSGTRVSSPVIGKKTTLMLEDGINEYGFYIKARPKDICGREEDIETNSLKWLDFQWFTITRHTITVGTDSNDGIPFETAGRPGVSYKFIARSTVGIQKNFQCIWTWDDDEPYKSMEGDSIINMSFDDAGSYTLFLEIIDLTSGASTGGVTQHFRIEADPEPTEPPEPPAILQAQWNSDENHNFIRWSDENDENEYYIYYGTSADLEKTSDKSGPLKDAFYEHREIEKGLTYYYAVTAINAAGESPLSPVTAVETSGSTVEPPEDILTPSVSVSPQNGATPTQFQQNGSGFTPNSSAKLFFTYPDGNIDSSKTVETDRNGDFFNNYKVTTSTARGTYEFHARDVTTGIYADPVSYTVDKDITPSVSVSPQNGATDTIFVQNGSGFTHNSTVKLFFKYPGGSIDSSKTIETDNNGNYFNSYKVTTATPRGEYEYYARDMTTGIQTGIVTYTVEEDSPPIVVSPSVAVTPSRGVNDTTFKQTGSGFTPGASVMLYFIYPGGNIDSSLGKPIDKTGNFLNEYAVTSASKRGKYSYFARDITANVLSDTVSFYITDSDISPSDSASAFADTCIMSCYGFTPNSSARLYITHSNGQIDSVDVPTGETGDFIHTYISSSAMPRGNYHYHSLDIASGIITRTPEAEFSFNINPVTQVTITPSSGLSGKEFAVEGSGFTPNSNAILYFQLNDFIDSSIIINSDASGSFTYQFTITTSTARGWYSVFAKDSSTQIKTYATVYRVLTDITPSVSVTPAHGVTDTIFIQSGEGLTPLEKARLYFVYPDAHIDSTIELFTSSSGEYTHTYKVTEGTPRGNYQYYARDLATGIVTSPVVFTVDEDPVPSFILSYKGNGESGGATPSSRNFQSGDYLYASENSGSLWLTGHAFAGWNTLQDGNGTDYPVGSSITTADANITLYAKWVTSLVWSPVSSGTTVQVNDIQYNNSTFVAVGGWNMTTAITTSADGVNWTAVSSPTNNTLYGVAWGDGKFVTVGRLGTVLISSDGSSWTKQTSGTSENLNSIAYGNNNYVAVGDNGTVIISSDGINWTLQNSSAMQLADIIYADGIFVAVGGVEDEMSLLVDLYTSVDGITWTAQTLSAGPLTGICYGNGLYVATDKHGGIFTSSDAVTWADQKSGVSYLSDITYGNDMFAAIGSGTVLFSKDGINWIQQADATGTSNCISFGKSRFIAAGMNGEMFYANY